MKRITVYMTLVLACTLPAALAQHGTADDMEQLQDWAAARNRSFYVGFGGGLTQFKTSGDSREMDGLDFTFDTDDDDLGMVVSAGYWIKDGDHLDVGVEVSIRNYGTVTVPFAFSNPHDNSSGTGEAEVQLKAWSLAVMLGYDLNEVFQLYGRVGILPWTESFDSRFDIPGQPAIERQTEDDGTGFLVGAGVAYRFTSTWDLFLQYDLGTIGDDDIGMASLGFTYDFLGLVR